MTFLILSLILINCFAAFRSIRSHIHFELHRNEFTKNGTVYDINSWDAIQLLSKSVKDGDGGKFHCYELNLIRADGERLNLISHSDIDSLRIVARTLQSSFANLEIFDRA